MRIALGIEGGIASFPGLRRGATLDTEALPEAERTHVCTLVHAARFFTMQEPPSSAAVPDARTYILEIHDGERHRLLRVGEPVHDPALAALLASVREIVARSREASPPAG